MGDAPSGRGIYDGFEGYRDPTEAEVLTLLETCPIILDTNVLLDIYGFEEPARLLALDVLESIQSRLWLPHQAMREFWRNRHSVIADIPSPVQPIDSVRSELLAIVNSLRPDRERPEEIRAMRETVETQLNELADAINKARGNPLNVAQILGDTSLDPVLAKLEEILKGRVGPSFGDDEPSLIDVGRKRFADKVPPGYKDGEKKSDQIPERGTGDYLMWEQTLRYLADFQAPSDAFVLVTNDAKEDWRINITTPKKRALGVRPELVAEALERTGLRLVLLQQSDFYRLMSRIRQSDKAASDSLVEASALSSRDDTPNESQWTEAAYEHLLYGLKEAGSQVQADIISLAAQTGGFISRAEIYEYAGYAEDRSLRRFAMPAQRIALTLIEGELLSEDAPMPLEAIYEGPGKTVGYRVPREFTKYEARRNEQPTWVQAAATVAATAPERVWTVNELVSEIRRLGILDLSAARTPEATLRRDLSLRDRTYFDPVNGGYKLRSGVGAQDGATSVI